MIAAKDLHKRSHRPVPPRAWIERPTATTSRPRSRITADYAGFTSDLRNLLRRVAPNEGGRVASHIPRLADVAPDYLALGVCTVAGERVGIGAANRAISLQSAARPITYAVALEEHGAEQAANAGPIISASLIRPNEPLADRVEHVVDTWTRLTGGVRPVVEAVSDRDGRSGVPVHEQGASVQDTELVEALELYFRLCTLELSASQLSVVAATLANGGVCPLSGESVLESATVARCLSSMEERGMRHFSGEWAVRVRFPAKSGASGVIMMVIPGVMGLAVWSPRVDRHGNSVRGVEFCERLVEEFDFHEHEDPRAVATGRRYTLGPQGWTVVPRIAPE